MKNNFNEKPYEDTINIRNSDYLFDIKLNIIYNSEKKSNLLFEWNIIPRENDLWLKKIIYILKNIYDDFHANLVSAIEKLLSTHVVHLFTKHQITHEFRS